MEPVEIASVELAQTYSLNREPFTADTNGDGLTDTTSHYSAVTLTGRFNPSRTANFSLTSRYDVLFHGISEVSVSGNFRERLAKGLFSFVYRPGLGLVPEAENPTVYVKKEDATQLRFQGEFGPIAGRLRLGMDATYNVTPTPTEKHLPYQRWRLERSHAVLRVPRRVPPVQLLHGTSERVPVRGGPARDRQALRLQSGEPMTGKVLVLGGTGRLGHAVIGELAKRDARWTLLAPRMEPRGLRDDSGAGRDGETFGDHPCGRVHRRHRRREAGAPRHGRDSQHARAWCAGVRVRRSPPSPSCTSRPTTCSTAPRPCTSKTIPCIRSRCTASPRKTASARRSSGRRAWSCVSRPLWPQRHGRPAYVDAIVAHARSHAAKGGRRSRSSSTRCRRRRSRGRRARVARPARREREGDRPRRQRRRSQPPGAGARDGRAGRIRRQGRRQASPGTSGRPKRPDYSVLGTSKLQGALGRKLPHWRDALARYLAEDRV